MATTNHNLATTLQELLNSIRQPLLFFIPSQLFPQFSKKNDGLNSIKVVDSIVVLNSDGSVKYIESGMQHITLLEKETILSNTTFMLLQQKSLLDNQAFEYLLTTYSKELLSWVDYTKIMIEHLKDETSAKMVDNYYEELMPFFELQHNILQQHKINYFDKFKETLIRLGFNANANKNKIHFSSVAHINFKEIEQDITDVMSEHEADTFLLQYVFNINTTD